MKKKNEIENCEEYSGKTYAYIGIALTAAGFSVFIAAVALALILTDGTFAVILVIAAIVSFILAAAYLKKQKKKNDLPWLKYVTIAAYTGLIAVAAFFIGGIIYAGTVE